MRTRSIFIILLLILFGSGPGANLSAQSESAVSVKGIAGQPAGTAFTDAIVGTLRLAPAGTFEQGSPLSEPCRVGDETRFQHTLTRDIAVMEKEVTRKMWADLAGKKPTSLPPDPSSSAWSNGVDDPVQTVSWFHAILFANVLSAYNQKVPVYYSDSGLSLPWNELDFAKTSPNPVYANFNANGYRLPTEGEWEYFTRAGTTTAFWLDVPDYTNETCKFYFSTFTNLDSVAWLYSNSADVTHPAGLKTANQWLLYDVYGNVREWVWDWYTWDYPTTPQTDYAGTATGSWKSMRGGSFINDGQHARSAYRYADDPKQVFGNVGFRLVRNTTTTTYLPLAIR